MEILSGLRSLKGYLLFYTRGSERCFILAFWLSMDDGYVIICSRLRLSECFELRVKDVDFGYNKIIVRNSKDDKDRVTILTSKIKKALKEHLKRVKRIHEEDLMAGFGSVSLPYALGKKYPDANRKWGW